MGYARRPSLLSHTKVSKEVSEGVGCFLFGMKQTAVFHDSEREGDDRALIFGYQSPTVVT